MAVETMYDATICYGDYDYSGDMNEVKVSLGQDMLESTVFGDTEHQFEPGLRIFDATASGFIQFDDTTDPKAVDYQLATEMLASNSTEKEFTFSYGGEGSTTYFGRGFANDYSPELSVAELGAFSFGVKASNEMTRGALLLDPETQRTAASGNGTIVQLGALSATQKMMAVLHVVEFDGTTLTVTLYSNDTNDTVTPDTMTTFTAATGATSEYKEVAGAETNTYWYVGWAFTGTSFKAAVSAGVK